MSKIEYSKDGKEVDKNYELLSFYQDDRLAASGNIHFNSCEFCRSIILDPNVEDVSRLLRVGVRLVNCCPGKEITVGCIVSDRSGRVLAYKSKTFIVSDCRGKAIGNENVIVQDKTSNCGCQSQCVDVTREFTFILPVSSICSPMDVNVRVIANYTSPACN